MMKFITGLALSTVASAVLAQSSATIGTMGQGSASYNSGSAIAKVVATETSNHASIIPFNGFNNAVAAITANKVNFAITDSVTTYNALNKKGPFENVDTSDIRVVAVLIPSKVGLYVRQDSGINSIKDLKGKRVAYGFSAAESVKLATDAILANGKLTAQDIIQVLVPTAGKGADELAAGNVDAAVQVINSGKLAEINAAIKGGVKLIPLSDDPADVSATVAIYGSSSVIVEKPKGNTHGFTVPTPVLAFDNFLISNKNVPSDLVYSVTKTLFSNKTKLEEITPAFKAFDPNAMAKHYPTIPFHPGAIQFYKESTLVK